MDDDDRTRNLGPELLAYLFAFLTPEEVLAARCVCVAWAGVARHIIDVRAARGGPFIDLPDSQRVPVLCTLPIFAAKSTHAAAHPAVATFEAGDDAPLMDRRIARKLSRLSLFAAQDWPADLLTSGALPHLRRLHSHIVSQANLAPSALRTVCEVHVAGPQPRDLAAATPACQRLSVSYCVDDDELARHVRAWPGLTALRLLRCETRLPWRCLPPALRELSLTACNSETHVARHARTRFNTGRSVVDAHDAPAQEQAADVPQPRQEPTQAPEPQRISVTLVPCLCSLETLEIVSVPRMPRVIAPALRTLTLANANLDAWNPNECPTLQHLRLEKVKENAQVAALDLTRLAASLRSICLATVALVDVEFLRCVPALEELTLESVTIAVDCRLPCECVPRLNRLSLDAVGGPANRTIVNLEDIGSLAALENLMLSGVALADLSWIGHLPLLQHLILCNLENVQSVSCIQTAPCLQTVLIDGLRSLRTVAVDGAACLRRLSLARLTLSTLALGATSVTHLTLHEVRCRDRCSGGIVVPARLRSLKMLQCDVGRVNVAKLSRLRRLQYSDNDLDVDVSGLGLADLPEPRRLAHLTLSLPSLPAHALAGIAFTSLDLEMPYAPQEPQECWPAGGLCAAALVVHVVYGAAANLEFVAPQVLRHFEYIGTSVPSLAPLRACPHLTYVSLRGRLSTLDELAGHPSLEEIYVGDAGDLDIAALLTCPRLAVADFFQSYVLHDQKEALKKHLLCKT